MGDALLHLGDCRRVMATLPAGSVDAIVTSPPYNLGASPHSPKPGRARRGKTSGRHRWEWAGYNGNGDNLPEDQYQAQQLEVLSECYRVCAEGASVFYVHKDRNWTGKSLSPRAWLDRSPFNVRQQITWDRGGSVEHSGRSFYSVNEWVFWLTKGAMNRDLGPCAKWGTVWRLTPAIGSGHPATFPLSLAKRCVLAGSSEGQMILDPYCGSGTTGVACLKTGRRFIGVEIDEGYHKIASRRLAEARTPLLDAMEGQRA